MFLQRPLWERYQQQVKDWEQAVSRGAAANHGKAPPIEKPPMFAFCLKARGLDIPSRGSKQRSQKKISVSGNNHTVIRDQDGFHAYGISLCLFLSVVLSPNIYMRIHLPLPLLFSSPYLLFATIIIP